MKFFTFSLPNSLDHLVKIKFDILRVSRVFSNLLVTHTKNVFHSHNDMQPFFLYVNNMFLVFPTAFMVIIDNRFNFQDFLSILKCTYSAFKKVSQVTELDVCHSNACLSLKKKHSMGWDHKLLTLFGHYSQNINLHSSRHVCLRCCISFKNTNFFCNCVILLSVCFFCTIKLQLIASKCQMQKMSY